MKKQKFEVRRTKEGTVFEVAFALLTVIVWAAVVVMLSSAPDTVPTHFSLSGQPDAYGSKWQMLLPCILTTVVGVCMMAGAYFPHTVSLPVRIRNARQAAWVVRMMRVVALGMLLLTAAVVSSTVLATALPAIVVAVLLVVACLVFTLLMFKAR